LIRDISAWLHHNEDIVAWEHSSSKNVPKFQVPNCSMSSSFTSLFDFSSSNFGPTSDFGGSQSNTLPSIPASSSTGIITPHLSSLSLGDGQFPGSQVQSLQSKCKKLLAIAIEQNSTIMKLLMEKNKLLDKIAEKEKVETANWLGQITGAISYYKSILITSLFKFI
jgi:hypothetical protein